MFRKSVSIDLVEPVVCLRGQPKDKQTINILRGAIRLQLSHSAIVHSVTIQFVGVSKTLWPEASKYWDKHILVDSIIPISRNLLLLKKGTHAFPFEILMSNALSESIECGLGHIRYKLLCQVHVKPRFLLFIKSILLKTQKSIVLIRLPSIENHQQCISQTHIINELGGQLTLDIEKGYLTPGTFLPITFNFNHSCLVHAIDQLSVKLVERQKYRAPSKQTTRILHHEIALSPIVGSSSNSLLLVNNNNEIRIVYVVPDKHILKVRATTSHPNIRIRHWIQISTRLLLKDGTIKELQLDISILVLLSPIDDYLTLPLYNNQSAAAEASTSTAATTPNTVPHALSSIKPILWLKKIYLIKNNNNIPVNIHNITAAQQHNNLMMLMTAPPPLYEDITN